MVSGGYSRSLAFSSGHSKQHTVAMATEAEQLCLELELINIEEQMLILQMLKRRRQRRRDYKIYFHVYFQHQSESIFMYQSVDFKHDIRSPVLSQRTNHSACGPRQRDA